MISMSFRNLTALTTLLNVISVRFFLSWSSQMTTLCRADESTKTIKLVLYIISMISTDSFKFWIFFLILSLLESFWMISNPDYVATAKYSWLWLAEIILTEGASGAMFAYMTALTASLSTKPFVVGMTYREEVIVFIGRAPHSSLCEVVTDSTRSYTYSASLWSSY